MKAKLVKIVAITLVVMCCRASETAEQALGSVEGLNDALDDQLSFLQEKIQAQDDYATRIENASPEELSALLTELQNSMGDIFGDEADEVIRGLENDAKAFKEEIPTEEEIQNYQSQRKQ